MSVAIYPGSFDPVTLGHFDIIERTAKVMDRVIIGVLNNQAKTPLFTVEERVDMLRNVTAGLPNVEIQCFDGLTIEFARKNHAQVVIRGLRAVTDFEYELQLAQTNRVIAPEIDTMFFNHQFEIFLFKLQHCKRDCILGRKYQRISPSLCGRTGAEKIQ